MCCIKASRFRHFEKRLWDKNSEILSFLPLINNSVTIRINFFSSDSISSNWHEHHTWILNARVPKFTTNNTTLPFLRALMDDLSLMATKVSGGQALLSQCLTALTWFGLEFRGDKSISTVIVKGRSMNTTPFLCFKTISPPRRFISYSFYPL